MDKTGIGRGETSRSATPLTRHPGQSVTPLRRPGVRVLPRRTATGGRATGAKGSVVALLLYVRQRRSLSAVPARRRVEGETEYRRTSRGREPQESSG